MYLTKTDFKACVDCPTRLYYRKAKYPSTNDEDEFLQFLADGGFMVEFIAKAQFPGGHDLAAIRDAEEAFAQTRKLLDTPEDVTLFEAAANHDRFHVRADILARRGDVLRLIEVKSSSLKRSGEDEFEDGESDRNDVEEPFISKKGEKRVLARWRPYLLDVAFQAMVLERAFPQFRVEPYLAVIDKGVLATEAETLGRFRLVASASTSTRRARPDVSYAGDVATLLGTKLIATLSVAEPIALLRSEVEASASLLAGLLGENTVTRVAPNLSTTFAECRDCEFRSDGSRGPSGFAECWKHLAEVPGHILDLHRVTQIGSKKCPDPVPRLLENGSASFFDLSEAQLGSPGAWATRRTMQWRGTREGRAIVEPSLLARIESHYQEPGYPLHFIDFEACNVALPHHAGLRPYERVAFQWSCHTVHADGLVTEQGWLNEDSSFPNFEFARTLRARIGTQGTVYVWSNYEQVTLRKILELLPTATERGLPPFEAGLAEWLEGLLGPADEKGKRGNSARIRDLHDLAYDHYFHPRMKGRTSIKVVLPAVWESDARLRAHPCFRSYLKEDRGVLVDPYHSLPDLPLGGGLGSVREGTGAIRVYQDLLFDRDAAPTDRQNRLELLRQYCRLDTAAMLMIWVHWSGRYDIHQSSAL